jgi:hypothetical protein
MAWNKVGIMRKILLIVSIFILTGCNQTSNENIMKEDSSKTLEDILEQSQGPSIDFTYIDTYFSFKDLIDDDYPEFYHGKVTRIEYDNIWVESVYFDVIKSENNEVIGEIWISLAIDQTRLSIGDEAVLYLSYIKSNSYYSLSSPYKSIFLIKEDEVYYSKDFEDLFEEIGNSKEKFLNKIFE